MLDTFDNVEPVEALDTFQDKNVDDFESEAKGLEEDETATPKETKETNKGKKESDSPLNQLKETEDEETEEKESSDETEDKSEGDDSEKDEAPKEREFTGRPVKIKMGDDMYDVDPAATVKVKVNGKNEIVSIKDLMGNYSGKVAYDEKFQELQTKNFEYEKESKMFNAVKEELRNDLTTLVKKLDNVEGSPLDALAYMAEMFGKDYNDIYKSLFETMAEQFDAYSMMNEVEQRLFWTEKKLESQNKKQEFLTQRTKQEQAATELQAKTRQAKERFGINDVDFESALKEFEAGGHDISNINPEQVAEYVAYKPYFAKATELCEQFSDDISENELSELVTLTSGVLFQYPKISETEALRIAASELGYDIEEGNEHVKALEEKLNKLPKPKQPAKSSKPKEGMESFDDFEF